MGRKFDIITEADARSLPPGEAVTLARGGHVTPLAQDTLRERRVVVVREGSVSADDGALAPPARIRSVAIAGDEAGAALAAMLVTFLRGRGLAVSDLGSERLTPLDYVDAAAAVASPVARGEVDAGIVVDATGIGSAIAANKLAGIRAATASSEMLARLSRERSGANVLTLGAVVVGTDEAKAIVTMWLGTPMQDPAEIRRLGKIRDLERASRES